MATFELDHPGGRLPLPVVAGTESPHGMSIGRLLADTGWVTLDPGFGNTAACTSAITYIDGDAGVLRNRGYLIQELAARSSFLDVAHLLIYGELPTEGSRASPR